MIPSIRNGEVRSVSLPSDTGSPKTVIGFQFYSPAEDQAMMNRMAELRRRLKAEDPLISDDELTAKCWDVQFSAVVRKVVWVKNAEGADGVPLDLEAKDAQAWASTLPPQYAYELIAAMKGPDATSFIAQGKECASQPRPRGESAAAASSAVLSGAAAPASR